MAILRCATCHQGCLAELRKGHGTWCLFNPLTGRESEVKITPVEQARDVLVAGGGPAGMETAMYLARRGIRWAVVKRRPEVGGKLDPSARALLLRRLESLGVDVRTGVEVVRFETRGQASWFSSGQDATVVARPWPHQEDAPELRFPAKTVIIAMGLRADHSLADALKAQDGPDVYVVGDCLEPRDALAAVFEGFEAGRLL